MDPHQSRPNAAREKKTVALTSVLAAVFLTGMKVVVGITTGSLGILAEALHSALDLAAAVMTYAAVRVADRPPDEEHLYGHGKVESFSALFETLLLVATAAWIIYEGIERLFFKAVEIDPSVWAFVVMMVSIVVDWSRSRALLRAARRHKSQALEADALHFSTDIWSSAVVLLGLALVKLGEHTGQSGWLVRADAAAALGVALIVLWVSVRLGKATVDVLLDRAPAGMAGQLAAEATKVAGVVACRRVRVRPVGPALFVDMVVEVPRGHPVEEAHGIVTEVEDRVHALHPQADVVVHFEPAEVADEGWAERVQTVAGERGLVVHEVQAAQIGDGVMLTFHLEVDPDLQLTEAHALADGLEQAIRQRLREVASVVTHIEPRGISGVHRDAPQAQRSRVLVALGRITAAFPALRDFHEISVRESDGRLHVSMHCVFDGALSIGEAHRLSTDIEARLKARVPEAASVHIHVEPPD
jgi:cation diffusion facilitator family transporter